MKLETLFSAIVKVDRLINLMIRSPEKYHWSQYEHRVYQQQNLIDAMFIKLTETQTQIDTMRAKTKEMRLAIGNNTYIDECMFSADTLCRMLDAIRDAGKEAK